MNNTNGIINEIKALSPEQESVKNLVIAKMQTLEQIRTKRKQLKEQLENLFLEDEKYKELKTKQTLEKKRFKNVKAIIGERTEVYELQEEIKALNKLFNETKQDISDYLVTYQEATGQLSFVNPAGQEVKIVRMAKPKIIKVKEFKK